jgi:hypothetical protein
MGTKTLWIRLDMDSRGLKVGTMKAKGSEMVGRKYYWKGTAADLVELIYGLKGVGVIEVEGRAAEIKEIAELFEGLLGKELTKIYYTRMMNQKRKKDKTPFLNRMIRAVMGGGGAAT